MPHDILSNPVLAILEGTLCESCGDYLGEGPGYDRLCPFCEREALRGSRVDLIKLI